MAEKTLAEEIITLVKSEANNNPAPMWAVIKKVYPGDFADVRLDNNQLYKYVYVIGDCTIGSTGVLVFIDGSLNNLVFISGNDEVNKKIEDIEAGEVDLSNLNIDLDLNFGLSGRDDSIVINMDIVKEQIINKIINLIGD